MYEATTYPFIVKIWFEETPAETGRAIWRGHITHVPSGEKRYLRDLDDITDFISPYLEGMGVKIGIGRRLCRWLIRCCLSLLGQG